MSSKPQPAPSPKPVTLPALRKQTAAEPAKRINGKFAPGYSGNPGGDGGRVRRTLNLSLLKELQRSFDRGGRKAIEKVMKNNPAMYLKMLVLLVPRELEVQHSGTIKQMTDEQLETAIEALQALIAAGANAKVINAKALPDGTPTAQERK